jgi:hypothetical protein
MVTHFGDYDTTETVIIPFNTFTSDDPSASSTITNLAAGDIEIHKDGGTTQRSSDNGVTVSINFDSVTGNHIVSIDLSDDTDSGFYSAGSRYQVRMEGTTVDGATVNAWIGTFSIGCTLRPTVDGRTLDVTATGAAGIDWGNVENPTTTVDLSATDIQLCDTVTTLTGHTVQTGDTYALANGATGFAAIDTVVDAILVDTNELQTDWADGGRLDLIVDAILLDTGTTLDGKIDTIDAIVDAILLDTAEIGAAGAGLTALATAASISALNDVAATDIVSAGAITTLAGAVVNVDLVDTLTTYTGNTPQTADNATNISAIKTKTDFLPSATAGGAGGVMIAGSNAATTWASMACTGELTVSNGVVVTCSTANKSAFHVTGNGTGHGIRAVSGSGATGDGINGTAASTTGRGMALNGSGASGGLRVAGGATGNAVNIVGGATSGNGINVTTTSGHGVNLAPVGTSKHGIFSTGGNGGTSDGASFVAGTGGVGIRGNITGNITGNVSGSVGSLTGHTVQTGDTYALANGATGFAAIDTVVDAILVDTNELQGDWTDGGRLDLIVDAILVDTGTTLDGKLDTIDGIVDAILVDTGTTLQAELDGIQADTEDIQTQIGTAGAGLTDLGGMSTAMKAEVNTEAKDVLFTDTDAEPGQGTPGATISIADKIGYLYKAWRNKTTVTATAYNLFNDDASTVDHKSTLSDDGTTFTDTEKTTGP